MSLFLVGSTATNPIYVEVFMKSNSPSKWILSPVIQLQSTLKVGNNIGTQNFNGKFVTSNSTSVCGLVTEKLGDLTKNFASDVKSVGLLLKPSEQLNSNYINSRYYTYLGGAVLKNTKEKLSAKTISGRSKSTIDAQRTRFRVHCGVINNLDYVWDGASEVSKVQILDESGAVLTTRADLFPILLLGNRFEDWYRGAVFDYSLNAVDEEIFVKKNFTCEYLLFGKGSIPNLSSKVVVPAELIRTRLL
jgi:hypothetical protein